LAFDDVRGGRGSGFSASTGVGTENGAREDSTFSGGAGRRDSDIARRRKIKIRNDETNVLILTFLFASFDSF
jgi:hypothetical protein